MAFPDQGVTIDEVQLAARNHGLPLEALRYEITPVGLHYLLIHYDIPEIDSEEWRLYVDGAVIDPLSVGLDDLKAIPAVTMRVVMECAGNGRARLNPRPVGQPWLHEAVGQAEWTGARLTEILDQAGVAPEAVEIVFTGADRGRDGGVEHAYQRSLPIGEAMRDDLILAYAMNGQPLLPQHGAPLRLVVPGWYGMAHVKWLTRISSTTTRFAGYHQDRSYRIRTHDEEAGDPVTRVLPRSLMIPPGIPEFLPRTRVVDAGPVTLSGRAWSGHGEVVTVEVSTDGGATWGQAMLADPVAEHRWRQWWYPWEASPGPTILCSRATDAAGNTQPDEPQWNSGGYQVNAIQRVPVEVRAPKGD